VPVVESSIFDGFFGAKPETQTEKMKRLAKENPASWQTIGEIIES